jgi:hypothetical protein
VSSTAHRLPSPGVAVPSLVTFPRYRPQSGWYLVVDPAGRYSIREDDGAVLGDHGEVPALLVGLTSVLGCATGVASCAWSAAWAVPFFLLGGFGGVIIGFLLGTAFMAAARREPIPGVDVHRVEPTDPLGWRLCGLVARIARTQSWLDGTIDPQRRAHSILWTALGRALIVDRRYPQFRTALHHGSAGAATGDTVAAMSAERASLAAVEAYLQQVLSTAIGVDRRQTRIDHEQRSWRAARRPDPRLRGGLPDLAEALAAAGDSDIAADSAAGLAAEAEVVATLLIDVDAMFAATDDPFRASRAA